MAGAKQAGEKTCRNNTLTPKINEKKKSRLLFTLSGVVLPENTPAGQSPVCKGTC